MALSEYKPKLKTIEFPGGSFEIRGLSLSDVADLVDSHEYVITAIVEKVQSRPELLEGGQAMSELLVDLIRESPVLVANIISLCADDSREPVGFTGDIENPVQVFSSRVPLIDIALRLPITVSLDALTAIAELTFTDMAAVKKFGANVMTLIRGILPPQTEALAE